MLKLFLYEDRWVKVKHNPIINIIAPPEKRLVDVRMRSQDHILVWKCLSGMTNNFPMKQCHISFCCSIFHVDHVKCIINNGNVPDSFHPARHSPAAAIPLPDVRSYITRCA
ncbi:uncharacterized protein [Drosophila pseudoobscura]|uniref:Uncharacterized protein n=1 Tax=Drosophila pseudoobscura pseudoobscura TaxID=46245 RepID=A0A6I8W2H5_DROPS|nr:uncharacterized protein LOC117184416 [Drosophila pseudoobscura]